MYLEFHRDGGCSPGDDEDCRLLCGPTNFYLHVGLFKWGGLICYSISLSAMRHNVF